MDMSKLRNVLQEKGFTTSEYILKSDVGNILTENNIEIWQKDNRVIAFKNYINEIHFKNWVDKDKIILVALLRLLNNIKKNNFYFLINLNINNDSVDGNNNLLEEINKLEKDSKICKKYVIISEDDLKRIPFLYETDVEVPQMLDYETKFKDKLKKINNITENALKTSMEYFEK